MAATEGSVLASEPVAAMAVTYFTMPINFQ